MRSYYYVPGVSFWLTTSGNTDTAFEGVELNALELLEGPALSL